MGGMGKTVGVHISVNGREVKEYTLVAAKWRSILLAKHFRLRFRKGYILRDLRFAEASIDYSTFLPNEHPAAVERDWGTVTVAHLTRLADALSKWSSLTQRYRILGVTVCWKSRVLLATSCYECKHSQCTVARAEQWLTSQSSQEVTHTC